jgi:hypothetical protein
MFVDSCNRDTKRGGHVGFVCALNRQKRDLRTASREHSPPLDYLDSLAKR